MDHNELTSGRIMPHVEHHACHLSPLMFTRDAFPQVHDTDTPNHNKVLQNFATFVAKAGAATGNKEDFFLSGEFSDCRSLQR